MMKIAIVMMNVITIMMVNDDNDKDDDGWLNEAKSKH